MYVCVFPALFVVFQLKVTRKYYFFGIYWVCVGCLPSGNSQSGIVCHWISLAQ